ncbi:MAG: hypothetical protein QW750_06240 [Zestosphaera sp.]
MLAGVIGLIALPVGGYIMGQFIGTHMALSDFSQGYSAGGLFNIFATNLNHTSPNAASTYNQMASAIEGYSISLANSDVNVLSLFGLLVGILLDAPLGVILYRVYKEI